VERSDTDFRFETDEYRMPKTDVGDETENGSAHYKRFVGTSAMPLAYSSAWAFPKSSD
jgi:hypothetical protein